MFYILFFTFAITVKIITCLQFYGQYLLQVNVNAQLFKYVVNFYYKQLFS